MKANDTYQRFAKFYDGYVSGFTLDLPVYQSFCSPSDQILEVGCGTGRVLEALVSRGCRVTGVDISDEMLDIAGQRLAEAVADGSVELLNHNFEIGTLPRRFNRVLVTFYTANYLLDDERLGTFLKNIAAAMDPGGMIIMDLFYPRPLAKPETAGIWSESRINFDGNEVVIRDRRQMRGNIELREQRYSIGGDVEEIITERRYFTQEEIRVLLSRSGFKDIQFMDGYNQTGFHTLKDPPLSGQSFFAKAVKE